MVAQGSALADAGWRPHCAGPLNRGVDLGPVIGQQIEIGVEPPLQMREIRFGTAGPCGGGKRLELVLLLGRADVKIKVFAALVKLFEPEVLPVVPDSLI